MSFLVLNPSNMIKTSKEIKLRVNIQTEIAGQELSEDIEKHTYPYVPFLHGYLEGGFFYRMLLPPPLMMIQVGYDAISTNYYRYALRQHDVPMHHPRRKPGIAPTDHFLTKGMFEVGRTVGRVYGRNIQKVLA